MWDAIALHTAFGIAEQQAPGVALVHYGINMDVGGVVADLLSASEINEVPWFLALCGTSPTAVEGEE